MKKQTLSIHEFTKDQLKLETEKTQKLIDKIELSIKNHNYELLQKQEKLEKLKELYKQYIELKKFVA